MSLYVNDTKFCYACQLAALGIIKPKENKNRKKKLKLTAEVNFNGTTKCGAEERYEVSILWLQVHPPLPQSRNISG